MLFRSPLISSAAVIVLIILFLFSIYGCRPDPGTVSCCFYFSKISVTVQYPHTYGNLPRSFPSDAWQVTSKNPFQIGFADGIFAFKPVFCYGQRSKCADLLNNYLSSIFIAFIFPSDSLSRLMGAEMAIYHIKYSIICLHAQAVLNMTARRFCRFFREPWSHFQYL